MVFHNSLHRKSLIHRFCGIVVFGESARRHPTPPGLYVVRLARPGLGTLQTAVAADQLLALGGTGGRDYLDVELRDGTPEAWSIVLS